MLYNKKEFVSYEEAQKWAKENKIISSFHWVSMCKTGIRPHNIPSNPNTHYHKVWRGWDEFLGENYVKKSKEKSISARLKELNEAESRKLNDIYNKSNKSNIEKSKFFKIEQRDNKIKSFLNLK